MSPLVNLEGQPIEGQFASEEGIEGYRQGSTQPYAQRRATPWRWDRTSPTQGMKIGWELRRKGGTVASYAFAINPQSISRSETPRTQLFATRSKLYVDDFGAGSGTIQISQYVASAKGPKEDLIGGIPTGPMSLREDVLNFYEQIYLKAVGHDYGVEPLEVWFYDNHLYHSVVSASKVPERVWFPAGSFSLERAVNLQNVWRLSLTMMALDRPPAAGPAQGAGKSGINGTVLVIARRNESVQEFARKHAGSKPSGARVKQVENKILSLNKNMRKNRFVDTYSPEGLGGGEKIGSHVEVKAMHVVAGEKVIVPA